MPSMDRPSEVPENEDSGEDMSLYEMVEDASFDVDCDEVAEEISDNEIEDDGMETDGSQEDESGPTRDDADITFTKHGGAVFCCHLDPRNSTVAVTGSEDEKAYVWNTSTGEIIFECSNNNDSVIAAEFSSDGAYLATGDMSGVLHVWKMATKSVVWSNTLGDDLVWLKWHPHCPVLFCAAASGEIYMWKIPSGECKVFPSHGDTCSCGVIMRDGKRAVFGYSKGSMRVYDLKSTAVLATINLGEGQDFSPYCMDTHLDNNLVVSGGGDGKVVVYKTQPAKVVAVFDDAKMTTSESADPRSTWVEAVQFCRDQSLPLVAAATLNGRLFIWDITKTVLRHSIDTAVGISRMLWDEHSPALYAGLLDGSVKIYDGRSGTLQSQLLGHKDNILDLALSRDGSTLLTASDDKTARVFSLLTPDR